MKSKKFVAFLVADVAWTIILMMMVILYRNDMPLSVFGVVMAVVAVKGFVQVGTIMGQASLDRYVRVAQINASMIKPDIDIPIEITKDD